MRADGRGFMNNLSNERLKKIASWREKYGNGHNVVIPAEEAEAMARELLALREAGKESVGIRWRFTDWRKTTMFHHTFDVDRFDEFSKSGNKEVYYTYAAPQLPAVHDDTLRMDWLCSMVFDVREPLVYGSHSIFWSQCDSADDEPHHTTLREQIDAAIAAAPKAEA